MEALFTTITFEKPPSVGALNGFRYSPEEYTLHKYCIISGSSPQAKFSLAVISSYFYTHFKEDVAAGKLGNALFS